MTSLSSAHGRSQAVPLSVFEQSKDAHIIRSDEEAIELAKQLAQEFAQEASERDKERRLPLNEIQQFSQMAYGLLRFPSNLVVPKLNIEPWLRSSKQLRVLTHLLHSFLKITWLLLNIYALMQAQNNNNFSLT